MAKLRDKIIDGFLDRVDDRLDVLQRNNPVEVIARGDPEEYARITKKSRIKLAAYAGGAAVSGALIGETDGALHVAAITGTAVSGWAAWLNASKLMLYGRGVDQEHSEQVRDHLDDSGR